MSRAEQPARSSSRPSPPAVDPDVIAAGRIAKAWGRLFGPSPMCIEATRCGIEALGQLGIPARPLPCAISVFNQFALAVAGRGVPIDQWPAWAHSIGVDPDRPPTPSKAARDRRWNGHLVIEGDTFIADPTLGAFAHPDKGLTVGPTAWQKDRDIVWFADCWVAACGTAGVVITPRTELAAWRTGSAWRRRPDPGLIAYLATAAS